MARTDFCGVSSQRSPFPRSDSVAQLDSPTPFDVGKEPRSSVEELGRVGHETLGRLVWVVHSGAAVCRLAHVDRVVIRVDVVVVGNRAASSVLVLLLLLGIRRRCRVHDRLFVGIRAVVEDLVVDVDLRASVDIASAAFAARRPGAVLRAGLHDSLVREALRSILIELHEDRLESWLDDERHQEQEREQTERAEQHEEGGCVENRFLF